MTTRPGLLTPSLTYKPIRYPWALEYCKQQHKIHWVPEEVPLAEDVRDWAQSLEPSEKSLLTHIFRFFTQSDVEVNDCYMGRYARVFGPAEVKMMLSAFSSMETIHILAYALLIETIGMPDEEFSAFMQYEVMREKQDYMRSFGVDSEDDILRTTAMFGGATEGLSLFASFAMLMNFPRHNRMKGMGQIVSWSIRDESLHCDGIIQLHNTLAHEMGGRSRAVEQDILDCFSTQVRLEETFVDLAFEMGPVPGLTAREVKHYIHFIADWRLRQLRLPPLFGDMAHNPLGWLPALISGVEHANFFETRATEYSKGSSRGNWTDTWFAFDQRRARAGEQDDVSAAA